MNRFFDIQGIPSTELLPVAIAASGLDMNTGIFSLSAPLRFQSTIAGGIIVVPVGFLSDLASIPSYAQWWMSTDNPRISAGAWVHDNLYKNKGKIVLEGNSPVTMNREQDDNILCNEAMPDLGANYFQCAAVYRALRLFGERW